MDQYYFDGKWGYCIVTDHCYLDESGDTAYSEFEIDLIYSLRNDLRAKTDYWVTAKPRFGWETHVWIHCYGMVSE